MSVESFGAVVKEVKASANSVNQSMEDISQLSKLTYNSSRQISQSLQQTGKIYQQLQGTIENFKIN
jgi:twitching motility protein PilJ